jgi:glutamine synthetase
LGTQVSDTLDKFENSSVKDAIVVDEKKGISLGVGQIPEILLDNTDRNRTSPFAFTGNRFEFRAVGSSANCASAMTALNAAVAEQLITFKKEVDKLIKDGKSKEEALYEVLKKYIKESRPIRFNGNGYSEEWKEEAKKRGLDCETSVPLIYDSYTTKQSIKTFDGVLSEVELHARNEVKWEIYTKKIQIESRALGDLALNHIIPVSIAYQSVLLKNVANLKNIFSESEKYINMAEEQIRLIEKVSLHVNAVNAKVHEMIDARKVANNVENEREKAIEYHDKVAPFLDEIRYHIDKLELIVDNEMWPLPKYRELLFIR